MWDQRERGGAESSWTMIHMTSCESVRDPGFSKSECLELARRIDNDRALPDGADIYCERWNCNGSIKRMEGLSPRERDTIVAALRAYAG